MPKFSLDKGKRAEREVCRMLQPIVDRVYSGRGEAPTVMRNSLQTRGGGADIAEIGFEWIAIEVKHQETLAVNKWWGQAKEQAGAGRVPVLIYKKNNVKWRVVMYGSIPAGQVKVTCPVDIALDVFLFWFEQSLMNRLPA
jgi:hypothetical protein